MGYPVLLDLVEGDLVDASQPSRTPQPVRLGRASPVPVVPFQAFRAPGSSSGLLSRFFTPSVAFALMDRARLSLVRTGGTLSTPQASLNATDRSFAPPKGLSTLGFDPARFQAKPPT